MFDFIKNLIFKKTGTNVVQLNTGSVKVHYNYEKQIDRLKQYGMIINDDNCCNKHIWNLLWLPTGSEFIYIRWNKKFIKI